MAVCESTGGYEPLLVGRLRKTRVAVHLAHPNRVRAFAKACGYEAKTDFGTPRCCPDMARCFQSRTRRVRDRNGRSCGTCCVATSTKRHIAWLDKEIAELDKEHQTALRRSAALD